jgi:hypothetical protein
VRQDGQTVYCCTLCKGSETLSFQRHATGIRHLENLRQHNEQIAREHRQRIENERREPSNYLPEVDEEDEISEENPETYNLEDDLDALYSAERDIESKISATINLNNKIEIEDLINAEIEEILCHQDNAVFEGDDYVLEGSESDQNDQKNKEEKSRWFPFKNKMVVFYPLITKPYLKR